MEEKNSWPMFLAEYIGEIRKSREFIQTMRKIRAADKIPGHFWSSFWSDHLPVNLAAIRHARRTHSEYVGKLRDLRADMRL
jgi:hypothetical protein